MRSLNTEYFEIQTIDALTLGELIPAAKWRALTNTSTRKRHGPDHCCDWFMPCCQWNTDDHAAALR